MKQITKTHIWIISIIVFIGIFSLRLYSIAGGLWDYTHTDVVCVGQYPTPPDELGEPAPFMIIDVSPYKVVSEVGQMYPGDEYNIGVDGTVGTATLLWAGSEGANFIVRYRSSESPEYLCRWYVPVGG